MAAIDSFAEAEQGLQQLTKAHITELLAFQRPPAAVVQVFQGLVILLAPALPLSDWHQIRKWLAGNNTQLLSMLIAFDRENISDEQLTRLNAILAKEECQPDRVKKCSLAAYGLLQWLRAIALTSQANIALRQEQPQQT